MIEFTNKFIPIFIRNGSEQFALSEITALIMNKIMTTLERSEDR